MIRPMLLSEREVRELAGDAVDTDEFQRPNQYGPSWSEVVGFRREKVAGKADIRTKDGSPSQG